MSPFSIPFHLRSEANIQAEFYHQCRLINLNCVLEINVPVGRLDVLVFSDDWLTLTAIVECKRTERQGTRQIQRYEKLGVPVHKLCSMDSAPLAKSLRDSPSQGVPWATVISQPRKKWRTKRRRDSNGILRRPFHPSDLDESINFKA